MKLIGLSGRKRSGKDTVCDIIKRLLPDTSVERIAFADALKEEVSRVLGVTIDEIEADKARFRGMLQWWGTEWRRHQDIEYWIKQARLKINASTADVVVVTDVRFQNEADLIRELGGLVCRIHRPDAEGEPDLHPSEAALESIPMKVRIFNDGGMDDLTMQVERYIVRHFILDQ